MQERISEQVARADDSGVVPISFVPTPTIEYRAHRKAMQKTVQSGQPVLKPVPIPVPPTLWSGSRVLMYKQDPSVAEIGIRKAFIPSIVQNGPKDGRVTTEGLPAVSRNVFGDFIQPPHTDGFDSVHTFTVVRQTLTMCQRARQGVAIPWQWNTSSNTDPLKVYPHGLADVMNAYYSRNEKVLKFGHFIKQGSSPPYRVYTCQSLDIVSHETGHAILDGLKPNWLAWGNPPQTGGLHESFGDLVAIFLALSQLDQVEAIIAQTKANLHVKTFLADLAEEFGLALGRPNGLRNADNDLKLSEVGNEVHAISQVFTGAIYDILADVFAFERKPVLKDDAAVLYGAGQYIFSLVLRAMLNAPASKATYADVANQMLIIAAQDGKPVQYRNFIRNRFFVREVVLSPTPLTENVSEGVSLQAKIVDAADAVQDRSTCCGTMQLDEYLGGDAELQKQVEELVRSIGKKS